MNIKKAHDFGLKGDGVKIALIDTKIMEHPEFLKNGKSIIEKKMDCTTNSENCVLEEGSTTDFTHATAVALAIGSQKSGVAPNSKIFSLNVMKEDTDKFQNIAKAIQWSIDNDIDVINISLSGIYNQNIDNEVFELIENKLSLARNNGVVIFASAGNPPIGEVQNNIGYPALSGSSVAVAGINLKNGYIKRWISEEKDQQSATGPYIELTASAVIDFFDTDKNKIITESGTSFSAPLVSGVFALLKQQFPNIEKYNEIFIKDTISNENQLNSKLLQIMKDNAIPMNGYKGDPIGNGDWEYGAGLVQAPPYNQKKELNLSGKRFNTYTKPIKEFYTGKSVGNKKVISYQEWYDWHKIKDENGEFSWINIKEGSLWEELPVSNFPSVTYPYDSIAQYMKNDGTYTEYIDGGYWTHEAKFKDFSYEYLDENYTYHPQEEVYEYYRLMSLGSFYNDESFYNKRLTFHQKLCQIEMEMYGDDYYYCDAEWDAKNQRYKGEITPDRVDYRNIYNLVLENSKGESYFVPIISPATFNFDIENQFFGPKTNNYNYADGKTSRYIDVKAILPTDEFNIFDFRGFYYSGDLFYGSLSYEQLGTTNLLDNLKNKLDKTGEQNLRLVDVIFEKQEETKVILHEVPVIEVPTTEVNQGQKINTMNETTKYVGPNTASLVDKKRWQVETEDVDLNLANLSKTFATFPDTEKYAELKEKNKYKNQYNLIYEDEQKRKHLNIIWTTSTFDFDIEKQKATPKTTDFVHQNGYRSESINLEHLEGNTSRPSLYLYSYQFDLRTTNLLSYMIPSGKLIDVVTDNSTDWFN